VPGIGADEQFRLMFAPAELGAARSREVWNAT
jgi:hypothetical protein